MQFRTAALIKTAAASLSVAFEPSVQMSTQWNKEISLELIKLFWPYKDLKFLGAQGLMGYTLRASALGLWEK